MSEDRKKIKNILNEGIDILTETRKYDINDEDENSENMELKDIEEYINSENGDFDIEVEDDKMKAYLTVIPPVGKGKPVEFNEVERFLKNKNIVYGVDFKKIENLLKEAENGKKIESKIIAEGIPVKPKVARKYVKLFENKKPSDFMDKNGKINYKEMNKILSVEDGEKIIQLIPGKDGENGVNIEGNEVFPDNVDEEILLPGLNVFFDEEDNLFYSRTCGRVKITDSGEVSVLPELIIDNDYDLNVGNIDYKGSIIVKKNILDGFEIKVTGDIIVDGSVYGSNIECGGNIFVGKGIVSKEEHIISAKKNITCKFIENSKIFAEGNISVSKAVVRSEICALGKVDVKGERGQIVGSKVFGFDGVECEEVGSSMGTKTTIGAGINFYLFKEIEKNEENIEELRNMSVKIRNYVKKITENQSDLSKMTDEIKKIIHVLSGKNKKILQTIEKIKNKSMEIDSEIYNTDGFPYIRIYREFHSGVSIFLGRARLFNNKKDFNVKFVWDKALNKVVQAAL
ncbi:MAG: DUF342 domain-containing protein [Candidatus Muiribacteriota bacterium]